MIADARNVPDGRTLESDVCVVGAGAAGITLARALAGSPLRVCLLESGGIEPDEPTQALYRGRVFGRGYFRLDECRTRRFGGSTHCWQGVCRPLAPIDLEVRDWVPESGWPFDLETLVPYYERAQAVCRLGPFDYRGRSWASAARPLLPLAEEVIETRVFQVAPTRFASLYREEVAAADDVDAYLFANAVELETDEGARRVDSVRVATLSGSSFRVRARDFVLATGGIENARLLLASNRRRPDGLGNERGLVGRFFMEHPHVVSAALLPASAELGLDLYRPHEAGRVWISAYLAASAETLRRERLLGFAATLAQPTELPEFEQALVRAIREMDGTDRARDGGAAREAVLLMCEFEQAPNPASRVRLTRERDALGLPRVQLDWRLSAIDKTSARRANEVLGRELGRAGIGRLQMLLSEDDHLWPRELSGGRHHMGTTRMHADPRRGVVDADCRVHGIANLFVAGSSVFPTVGAADPTLTLVALALRLADHLREVLA